jgi:cytochrome P450
MEEPGFWLITRVEDVSRALADPATFSSSREDARHHRSGGFKTLPARL